MEGEVWADNQYGGYEEAVYSAGLRHGPARTFGPCPNRSALYKVIKLYRQLINHFKVI